MAEHKEQHFVPRCHLKPFATDATGRAICIYNIKSEALISSASLRGQCAKSYFYGRDLEIERQLQTLEGQYAAIVRAIEKGQPPSTDELNYLRDFALLQFLRTDQAARRQILMQHDFANLVFENSPEQRPDDFTSEEAVRLALKDFSSYAALISDLKVVVVKNDTQFPFATSDDPAILVNRFYAQRLGPRWNSFGLSNAGVQLYLPLTPYHVVCGYDGDIYTCPDRHQNVIVLKKQSDVFAINKLQYLKSAHNVYFFDFSNGDRTKQEFEAVKATRPTSWHEIRYAVKEEKISADGTTRFKVVHTKEERDASSEGLIHVESLMLDPAVWCSKIQFRSKLKYIDTGTGAGFRRRSSG